MSETEIEKWLQNNNVNALGIGVIKNGKVQKTAVYGKACKDERLTNNTLFNVASLTKPIVAVLILRLVNEGLWSLDEPVANYWTDPDLLSDERAKSITTRHLLSHQGGFPNWRWMDSNKKLAFRFDPGTRFSYSGEGYEYLRHALEKKFQLSLEQLADSFLFRPLKMTATTFHAPQTYLSTASCLTKADSLNSHLEANAADDVFTTIDDYTRFGISILKRKGLSQHLYKNMIAPQAKIKENDFMGLGWEILPGLKGDEFALLHTGSDVDAASIIILLPKTREGLVVFTNSQQGFKLYPALITSFLSLGHEIMGRAK